MIHASLFQPRLSGAPPQKGQETNVIALIDGSEEVVEPFLVSDMDSLEKAEAQAGPNLHATAELFRVGTSPAHKIAKGLAILGINVALPVVGHMLLGKTGLVLGGLAAAGMFGLGLTRQGLGEIESGLSHRKYLKEPEWEGQRRYVIVPDKTDGIDSKPVEINPTHKKVTQQDFADELASDMRPHNTNIVFIAGHGLGYLQSANMPVKQISDALKDVAKKSGDTADVVVMESCMMGNVEAMLAMGGAAKVAVVSEEVLNVKALPLQQMFADAATNGGTPQEIAARMVKLASATGKVKTLAAIDLSKMPALSASMDRLGSALCDEMRHGRKADVQQAMKEAMRFPKGKLYFLERALLNFSDFRNFVGSLEKKGFSPATQAALADTKAAVNQAILATTTTKPYSQASGLSFQSKPSAFLSLIPNMGKYNDLPLPGGWTDFIAEVNRK